MFQVSLGEDCQSEQPYMLTLLLTKPFVDKSVYNLLEPLTVRGQAMGAGQAQSGWKEKVPCNSSPVNVTATLLHFVVDVDIRKTTCSCVGVHFF